MKTIYYGRISTTEGQTSGSQYDDAKSKGVDAKHIHIDERIDARLEFLTCIAIQNGQSLLSSGG